MRRLLLPALLFASQTIDAQVVVLQDGSLLAVGRAEAEGDSLRIGLTAGSGHNRERVFPRGLVSYVLWEPIPELPEARRLLRDGKAAEADVLLAALEKRSVPFGELPGNIWGEVVLLRLDVAVAEKNEARESEFLGQIEAKIQSLPIRSQLLRWRLQRAVSRGDSTAISLTAKQLSEVSILAEDQALAGISLGDQAYASGRFEEAHAHYLRVSVLHGSAGSFLPAAELGVAKCLQSLGRRAEALLVFRRVSRVHAGTTEASFAAAEAARLAPARSKITAPEVLGLPPL